jgi:phosphate starvation-inducible PhoH-like protein
VSARTSRDAPVKKRREATETLHFEDPELVKTLAGANDRHLALIEEACDVLLTAPGGAVTVTGRGAARETAKRILTALYDQLAEGRGVGEEEVRAALHMDSVGRPAGVPQDGVIHVVRGRSFKARTPRQLDYVRALADPKSGLVFGVGPAGTGKTFLAVAYGASLLASHVVERLVVARPAVEAGEKLGFLPGDLTEKVDPYMLPIWDALRDSLGQAVVDKRREDGSIEVAPLAFMRGRTLSNAFVIVDEAQNATVSQMQMVLTRIGEGSRMTVTGDPSQIDLPSGQPSGLVHALDILAKVDGVTAVRFGREDVVRHPLVGRIVEAYERDARKGGKARR